MHALHSPKTHCRNGHPLSGPNLLLKSRRRNGRIYTERRCRACKNAQERDRRRRVPYALREGRRSRGGS